MQQRATATGAEAAAYNQEVFVYRFVVSYKTGKKSKTFLEDQRRELAEYDRKHGLPVASPAAFMGPVASTSMAPVALTGPALTTRPGASTAPVRLTGPEVSTALPSTALMTERTALPSTTTPSTAMTEGTATTEMTAMEGRTAIGGLTAMTEVTATEGLSTPTAPTGGPPPRRTFIRRFDHDIPIEPRPPGDTVIVRVNRRRGSPPPIRMPSPTLLHRQPPGADAMDVDPVDGPVRKLGEIEAEEDSDEIEPSTSMPPPKPPVKRTMPVATGQLYEPPCERCVKEKQDCQVARGGGSCVFCRWRKIRCMYGAARSKRPPHKAVGESQEEMKRKTRRPAPVAQTKQKRKATADAAREARPSRVAGEKAKDAIDAMAVLATDDERLSAVAKGKRKVQVVIESESDEPSISKRRKEGDEEEQKEQSHYEEWLEEVRQGTRVSDRLGGSTSAQRFENLEREVARQGELLSSLCEYLGIPETGIPRLPLRWEEPGMSVKRVYRWTPEQEDAEDEEDGQGGGSMSAIETAPSVTELERIREGGKDKVENEEEEEKLEEVKGGRTLSGVETAPSVTEERPLSTTSDSAEDGTSNAATGPELTASEESGAASEVVGTSDAVSEEKNGSDMEVSDPDITVSLPPAAAAPEDEPPTARPPPPTSDTPPQPSDAPPPSSPPSITVISATPKNSQEVTQSEGPAVPLATRSRSRSRTPLIPSPATLQVPRRSPRVRSASTSSNESRSSKGRGVSPGKRGKH